MGIRGEKRKNCDEERSDEKRVGLASSVLSGRRESLQQSNEGEEGGLSKKGGGKAFEVLVDAIFENRWRPERRVTGRRSL